MKKEKTTLSVILFLVTVHLGIAQDYAFKVLVNKGKNEVKKGSSWQPVKVGATLTKNDEIRLSDNAYIGLMHKSGRPLEVKEAGSHRVSALEESIKPGASVLTKYADFMLSSNDDPKNNRLKATGAVTRGPENILVYLPTTPTYSVVYGDDIIISWDQEKMAGPFEVIFTNPFGDELKVIKTESNRVLINLGDKDFQFEDNILPKIYSKNDRKESPDQLMLKRLSKADKERVKKQLDEISATTQEQTALNKFILAGFFESQNLLIDASTAYQRAIELAPDVPEFQEYYKAFLTRTGMNTR